MRNDPPLAGLRVVVTRPRHQRSRLVERLRAEGADAVSVPTIAIVDPVDDGAALTAAALAIDSYDWVVFSSANAVERVVARLPDISAMTQVSVAAMGTATVAELERHGVQVDLVPERFIAESLLEVFPAPTPGEVARVLLPSAEVTRGVLPDGLRAKGWSVDEVVAYRTVAATIGAAEREAVAGADAVLFTSGSTVEQWVAAFGDEQPTPIVACIGPATAEVAGRLHIDVDLVAEVHTTDGLVDALITYVTEAPGA